MLNKKVPLFIWILLIFFLNFSLFAKEKERPLEKALILSKSGNMIKSFDNIAETIAKPKKEEILEPTKDQAQEDFNKELENIYNEGVKAFTQGNYKDALKIFKDLLPFYPNKVKIIFHLGKIKEYLKQDKYEDRYIHEDMDSSNLKEIIKYNYSVAKDSFFNHEYIKAYDFAERVIILDPSKKKLMLDIQEIDVLMNHILEKRESFNIEKYHYARSYFFFKDGKIDQAIDEWEKVIVINPGKKEIKYYLSLFKSKEYQTRFELRKINFMLNEGIEAYNNSYYDKALNLFYGILEINDDEVARIYIDRCNLKIKLNEERKEVVDQRKVIKEDQLDIKSNEKKFEETKNELVSKKYDIKDVLNQNYEKKKEEIELSKKEEITRESEILYKKGLEYYYNGNYPKAKECWEKILKYDPHNKKVLQSLRKIYSE